MKKRLSEESFTSSQNSPGNDENTWDKMPSCPTFLEESFTSSQNSPGNDENSWDKMASCPTFSEEVKSPEKRSALKVALLFTLCLRVFYSAVGALAAPYLKLDPGLIRSNDFTDNLMPRSAGLAYGLLGVWERFDTLWYVHIAQSGYDRPDAVVFYPLYPLLIRTFTTVLWRPLVAALLISTASCFFLFWGFQKLFELDLPRETVQRAMVFYAAWPASFMLFA